MYFLYLTVGFLVFTSSDCVAEHDQSCLHLLNCTTLVASFSTNGLQLLQNAGIVSAGEILDTMCSLVVDAHTCIDQKRVLCPHDNYLTEVETNMEVPDYTCQLRNRDSMIEILSSECSQSELRRTLLISDIQGCSENFLAGVQAVIITKMLQNLQPEPFDFCPVVDKLKVCFINRANSRCGRKFAMFFRKIWTMSMKSDMGETMQDCFQEMTSTRNAMHRYIPTLTKKP